jgi:hypothetical protein
MYGWITFLSDVDGDILQDMSLLEYESIFNKDIVHKVVALYPSEGGSKVQVVRLFQVLKLIFMLF